MNKETTTADLFYALRSSVVRIASAVTSTSKIALACLAQLILICALLLHERFGMNWTSLLLATMLAANLTLVIWAIFATPTAAELLAHKLEIPEK